MAEFARSLAIVIGINQYGNGISMLQTAVDDAKAIARILEQEHKYTVRLLLDQAASLQALQQILDQELTRYIHPDDRLLFYFAGHGIALNGEDGPEGFLIPQDAKLGDTKSYLPMAKLQAALSDLPCRHFLGILDCCFAGAFRWSSTRKLVPVELGIIHKERFDRFIQDPAWQVITSAASDQTALDAFDLKSERVQTGKHSPFAATLIEALSGQADLDPPAAPGKPAGDGVTTATELYLYLRDRIETATAAVHHRQTPGIWPLKKHDKGEYIFLTPGHVLNLPPAPPLDESRNPYRGLQSFEAEQSDLFFGRQALTAKLGEFVRHQPLTVVLGASGSGKSSLVKAGLIPHLKQQDTQATQPQWQILTPLRPGESPFKALSNALDQENVSGFSVPDAGSAAETEMLTQYIDAWSQHHPGMTLLLAIDQFEELITLCRDEKQREQFLSGLAQAVTAYPKQLRLVLTLRSDFEPQFQDTVMKGHWSIARFVVPPMTRSELREAIEEPASKRVMYFESDDPKHPLIDQLIDEVAEMPGALPLLSFTLSELYLKYLHRQKFAQDRGDSLDRAIIEADYKALGGVARSLTQRADQEYEALVKQDPEYAQIIQNVMLRMVVVGGGELARRRVPLAEFEYPLTQNDRVKAVIQHFSAARLVVEGQDSDGKPYAEPAHDALVRGWQKLLTWKQEQEESLILQRRLTPAAEEWKQVTQQKQATDLLAKTEPVIDWLDRRFYTLENLLSKASAQVARRWQRSQQQQERSREKSGQFLWNTNPYLDVLYQQLQSNDNWFNQVESEFVQKSVLQRRKNTSWRWRIATAVILGLSGLTIAALVGQRNAQIEQAQASRQAAEANLLSKQELDSLINALRAGRSLERLLPFGFFKPANDLAQVRQILQKAIDQSTERNRLEVKKILERSQGSILTGLSFGENNRLLATTISSSTIELWNFESQQRLRQFDASNIGTQNEFNLNHFGPDDGRLDARFSPDGSTLAIQLDGAVQLWDVQSKQLLVQFPSNSKWDNISFSPNGNKFLAVNENGGPRLLNLESKKWVTTSIELPKDLVLANVIWSNSGEQLMLSDFSENVVYTWDLNNETIVRENINSGNGRTSILSPNRKLLANIGIGNGQRPPSYEFWDLASNSSEPTLIKSFEGYHPLGFNSIIWGHDDKKTATIDSEGIVRLWYLHKTNLEQNPQIGTANLDSKSSRVGKFSDSWDLETREKLEKIKEKIKNQYPTDKWNSSIEGLIGSSNLTFSPDGTKLAIVDDWKGRFFYFWNLETQQELKQVKEELHNLTNGSRVIAIEDLSFSADGRFLAIANSYNLRLWDLENNQWLDASFQGDISCDDSVQTVVFSPDSQLLATRSGSYVCLRNLAGYQLAKFEDTGYAELSFSPDSTVIFTTDKNNNIIQTWRFESFNELMTHACSLVHDYLSTPSSDANEIDRHICDGISIPKSNEAYSVAISSPQAPPQSPTPESTDKVTLTPSPTFSINNKGEMKFAPGKTSARMDGEVKSRTINSYTFGASSGQTVRIGVNAVEQVFIDVWQPDGNRLTLNSDESGSFSATLPVDGTYTIDIVNKQTDISSSYSLSLEIEP